MGILLEGKFTGNVVAAPDAAPEGGEGLVVHRLVGRAVKHEDGAWLLLELGSAACADDCTGKTHDALEIEVRDITFTAYDGIFRRQ